MHAHPPTHPPTDPKQHPRGAFMVLVLDELLDEHVRMQEGERPAQGLRDPHFLVLQLPDGLVDDRVCLGRVVVVVVAAAPLVVVVVPDGLVDDQVCLHRHTHTPTHTHTQTHTHTPVGSCPDPAPAWR